MAEGNPKVAFITGITGQDGSYLAESLLKKGYNVRGMVRRSSSLRGHTERIAHLIDQYGEARNPDAKSIDSRFYCSYGDMTDASSMRGLLEKFRPDEVYNLAAQSHVGISFDVPDFTFRTNAQGPLKLLEAIKDMRLPCRFYQASSSEMFGSSPPPQSESTPFRPQSPYGVSKVAAFNTTRLFRDAYGIFAANGILFNHESPRRGENFVTRKITMGLAGILLGQKSEIVLGNLDAKRDWGHSKEYVGAMWKILQQPEPDDFVIATGETHTVREFMQEAFGLVGLDYQRFLRSSDSFKRPAEVPALQGDATKAKRVLGWDPKVKFKELVKTMVAADVKYEFEKAGVVPITPGDAKPDNHYLGIGREHAEKLK
jgi:GDPmannose 4,6-dehydratase